VEHRIKWIQAAATVASLMTGVLVASSCGGSGFLGLQGGSSPGGVELSGSCSGDFGAGAAAKKLDAFVGATKRFSAEVSELSGGLATVCKEMGRELGLSDGAMAPSGGTPKVKAACDAVAARLRADIGELRGSAGLRLAVVTTPPVCKVSVDAAADCYAKCEADVDPGGVTLECEGGELRGGCSAECTGTCAVEASASCEGTCEGSCSAGCSGTCRGECSGECAARNAEGACEGSCSGGCEGTCDGGCSGTCEGTCVAEVSGECSGECRGGCSVELTEPTCTGEVRAPEVSAECDASCDASLDAEATCEPGQVTVVAEVSAESNVDEQVARLEAALRRLPRVLTFQAKLARLRGAGEAMVEAGKGLPEAVAGLGMNAVQCANSAIGSLPPVTTEVSFSVEASASVGAAASAG
jgi:hypothetical protein